MKKIIQFCFLFCAMMFSDMAEAHSSNFCFQLREFAGDWILSSSSAGGVGVNSGPGISSAVLRHVTFDKHGSGTENNVTRIFYLPDGTLFKSIGENVRSITLNLTDPINGAGNITIVDNATINGVSIYNFIATRNKRGKINKLYLILIEGAGNTLVVTGVLERQQED